MKKKWICTVCGYVHEGDEAPEFLSTFALYFWKAAVIASA